MAGRGPWPERDSAGRSRPDAKRPWSSRLVIGAGLAIVALVAVIASVSFFTGRDEGERAVETVGSGGNAAMLAPLTDLGTPTAPVAPGGSDTEALTLLNDPRPDGMAVVCLDPGHGGADEGFVQPGTRDQDTLVEAELNLTHAQELAARLEEKGVVVVLTRSDDAGPNDANLDVNGDGETYDTVLGAGEGSYEAGRAAEYDDLQARINICNRASADVLVSMHINGFDARPSARGFETWYTGCREFGEQSEHLAGLTYRALANRFDETGFETEPRGVKDDCTVDVDPNDTQLAQSMLMTGPEIPGEIKPSEMPGVLVESLFVSNPDDAAFLASEEGKKAIVSAYEDAILAFFAETP